MGQRVSRETLTGGTGDIPKRIVERVSVLVQQYCLPTAAVPQLLTILALLEHEPAAVTTVRDPNQAAEIHIADSLTGLRVEGLSSVERVADLGSGGGFPGLVLAVALPGAQVTLVESVGRKCSFLQRVVDTAAIDGIAIVNTRAEAWKGGIGRCDLVTARALASLNVLCEYAAPLLQLGGLAVFWKGLRNNEEESDGRKAAAVLGLVLDDVLSVGSKDLTRHLYVFRKVAPTPDRYPRRVGVAVKRPIRGAA